MGASLALAGISGCSIRPAPQGTIVPYVRQPEQVVPGRPLFFATTMVHGGDAVGLLVESHEGRPIKIEGNPDHPASLGATSAFHQASVLTLYDPARSQAVVNQGRYRGWDDADAAIAAVLANQQESLGKGIRVLSETINSPTLRDQKRAFLERFPEAKWHQYSAIDTRNSSRAAEVAFGRALNPIYDLTAADVVLSLDADFLVDGPGHLRCADDFMQRRRVRSRETDAHSVRMNRLYMVEASVTCTGTRADHRLAVRMNEIEPLARDLAIALEVPGVSGRTRSHGDWINAVGRDLRAHAGRCVVIVGYRQPITVHLLAAAINLQLGNVGSTVKFVPSVDDPPPESTQSLQELVNDIEHGDVKSLFILGGNPVHTAPADLRFGDHLRSVDQSFRLSLYEDETSRLCQWHLPETHYLESWSDAIAFDGTASIVQPLIVPLYEGRSVHEVVAVLAGSVQTSRSAVEMYWRRQWKNASSPNTDFEVFWKTALHDGVVADTSSSPVEVTLLESWNATLSTSTNERTQDSSSLQLIFAADPSIYDGRYGLNSWLQELPKPITKLTWGNAAIISPNTARQYELEYQRFAHGGEHGGYEVPVVRLQVGDRRVDAPVWIMPGHADGAVTIYLGHGRTAAARADGHWQSTLGSDAYPLRTTDHLWWTGDLQLEVLDATSMLACTQAHHTTDGRESVRTATLEEYRKDPRQVVEKKKEHEERTLERISPPTTLYEPFDYEPPTNKWGMAIDMTACIGCNACVVACQAENNIPVVGKEQVLFGREMHWLRVDRYVHGRSSTTRRVSLSTCSLHALRTRPLRVRLPGRGHRPQRRRA